MDSAPVGKKNWSIEAEAFDAFLKYLDCDPERAGDKYEKIRQRVLTLFRCNGCRDEEALADETLDRAIRRIDAVNRLGEPPIRDLMPFITGVARHVVSEYYDGLRQYKQIPLDQAGELRGTAEIDAEQEQEMDRRLRCLERCLPMLDAPDRELILEWYLYQKSDKIRNKRRLAALRRASPGTLRIQAYRARQKLRKLMDDCLTEFRSA